MRIKIKSGNREIGKCEAERERKKKRANEPGKSIAATRGLRIVIIGAGGADTWEETS